MFKILRELVYKSGRLSHTKPPLPPVDTPLTRHMKYFFLKDFASMTNNIDKSRVFNLTHARLTVRVDLIIFIHPMSVKGNLTSQLLCPRVPAYVM